MSGPLSPECGQDPTPYAGDGWLNLQKDGPQDQRGAKGPVTAANGHSAPVPARFRKLPRRSAGVELRASGI